MLRPLLALSFAFGLIGAAAAQTTNPYYPYLPPMTVVGNPSSTAGPSQAVPFSAFTAALPLTVGSTAIDNGVPGNLEVNNNNVLGEVAPGIGVITALMQSVNAAGGFATYPVNAAELNGSTFAAPGPIGSTTPSTGAFTTLTATGPVSGAGFSNYLASPPAIGGTVAAPGSFTSLSAAGAAQFSSTMNDPNLQTTGSISGAVCQDAGGDFIYVASGNCFSGGSTVLAGWGISVSGATASIATANPAMPLAPVNLELTASVGTNALTINIVGNNGSAPSATNPVLIPVRDATIANGDPVWMAITSALSLTVPSGQTLGTANGTPFRFWIVAFNSGTAGSPVAALGLINCAQSGAIYPLAATAQGFVSTTAIASAPSAGIFYTGSALTSKAFAIIGYATYESGLTTAGSYASVPTKLQLFGPGVATPGQPTGNVGYLNNGSGSTNSTTSYVAVTGATVSLTPMSAVNLVKVTFSWFGTVQPLASTNVVYFSEVLRGTSTVIGGPYAGQSPTASGGTGWEGGFSSVTMDAPASAGAVSYNLYHKTSNASSGATTGEISATAEEIME